MIRNLFLTLLVLLLPTSALANDLEGAWALQIDEATIFRFDIERSYDGRWSGSWTRPDSFASNGMVFMRLVGSERLVSMAGLEFAGDVELSFDDPRPGAIPDIFRFRHIGEGRAQMTYVGTDFAPYPLIRVAPGTPLGPFEEGRVYDRDNAATQPDFGPDAEILPLIEPEPLAAEPLEPQPVEDLDPAEPEPELTVEPTIARPIETAEQTEPAQAEPAQTETENAPLIGADFLDGL